MGRGRAVSNPTVGSATDSCSWLCLFCNCHLSEPICRDLCLPAGTLGSWEEGPALQDLHLFLLSAQAFQSGTPFCLKFLLSESPGHTRNACVQGSVNLNPKSLEAESMVTDSQSSPVSHLLSAPP